MSARRTKAVRREKDAVTGDVPPQTLIRLRPKLKTSPLFKPSHLKALRLNTALIQPALEKLRTDPRLMKLALPEQPYDRLFLTLSPLYRSSRERFLRRGGVFQPKLTTSPRSLSSLILTENRIEYTPHQSELFWRLEQPARPDTNATLHQLITYSTSLFHEQNHRLLWQRIPPPRPLTRDSLRRYLNFMESLVVMLDMALGDELGPEFSSLGYLSGTLYDPGTPISFVDARAQRNYLQVALQATFLALEGYAKLDVRRALMASPVHSGLPREAIQHALDRALRLDEEFIERTNPTWQKKWEKTLLRSWGTSSSPGKTGPADTRASQRSRGNSKSDPDLLRFDTSKDPLHWTSEYLLAEAVLDAWGIA